MGITMCALCLAHQLMFYNMGGHPLLDFVEIPTPVKGVEVGDFAKRCIRLDHGEKRGDI